MAHRNIPIFIPHMGCPHQCVFCNQHSISGQGDFDEESVDRTIQDALATISPEDEVEIAFFGGSFTGIDRGLMVRLLETAERYVKANRVSSIRLSTRPDYISTEILELLGNYSVKHIELGLQSMDDRVLSACRRGHTRAQALEACRAIVEAGFELTGQMMIGLPNATPESETETAKLICSLGAKSARIYPTVVFYDTPLAELTRIGVYQPLSVEEAAERSATVLRIFLERGVEVIRIGLCASESLTSSEKVMAGPNHPALGELVWNEYNYQKIEQALLKNAWFGKPLILTVPKGAVSKVVGQRRRNLDRLLQAHQTEVKAIQECETATDVLVTPWQE